MNEDQNTPIENAFEDEAGAEAQSAPHADEDALRAHFDALCGEAERLKELVPDFDLSQALTDPEFIRRTAPGRLPADEAYFGMHYREILARREAEIRRRARLDASAAVQSGSVRPRENGGAASAPVLTAPNLRAMPREQRLAYIRAKYGK